MNAPQPFHDSCNNCHFRGRVIDPAGVPSQPLMPWVYVCGCRVGFKCKEMEFPLSWTLHCHHTLSTIRKAQREGFVGRGDSSVYGDCAVCLICSLLLLAQVFLRIAACLLIWDFTREGTCVREGATATLLIFTRISKAPNYGAHRACNCAPLESTELSFSCGISAPGIQLGFSCEDTKPWTSVVLVVVVGLGFRGVEKLCWSRVFGGGLGLTARVCSIRVPHGITDV